MEKELKNPVWASLCETHNHFLIDYSGVKFYNPEICTFGAFNNSSKITNALNEYIKQTDNFFLVSEKDIPVFDESLIKLDKKIEGCQMVLQNLITPVYSEKIVHLSSKYIEEIYNLIWLVMPGYYQKRTFEMGNYYGIFKEDKLVSITGQRMQTASFIEVSAVVTHPDYTRKGFAQQLVSYTCNEILKAGKTPILHTTKGNKAILLYEKLGFKITRDMNWWYFCKR